MLSCRDLVELETAYRDGHLRGCLRMQYRLHLWMCAGCQAWAQQGALMANAARSLGSPNDGAGPVERPP